MVSDRVAVGQGHATHFLQWREIRTGRVVGDSNHQRPTLDVETLGVVIGMLEKHADHLLLLPAPEREGLISRLASEVGVSSDDLKEMWAWWEECGHKVRVNDD